MSILKIGSFKEISFKKFSNEVLDPDISFKAILIGPSNVGKSSILLRYIKNEFSENHCPTIGIEYGRIFCKMNKKNVIINIWDTAGTEKYKSVVKNFYRGSNCIFLIFDMCDPEGLTKIIFFINQIEENADKNPLIILVGNKSDQKDQGAIYSKEIELFTEKHKMDLFFEVSAKTGEGINEMIESSIKLCYYRFIILEEISTNDWKEHQNKKKIFSPAKPQDHCNCT